MNTELLHIADRVLNTPLLLLPSKAEVVMAVLGGRIGINSPEASRFVGESHIEDEAGKRYVPFKVSEGVGVVTITGSLVNRGAWVGASSGLTSYEGIQHQLNTAKNETAVNTVLLDLHTPGGEAVGAFETAAVVRELAKKKRVVAFINGMAASAGYAIASGATEIVTTETGVSGSIGVVLLHADFSRKLDRDGITPTLIHAGARKVDGNPFQPLSKDVKANLQAEVDALYEAFLKTVHLGRGSRLTVDAARATEAETFIGQAAVERGLADRVGTFETALADLVRATPTRRKTAMDTRTFSQAELDTAVATARAEGVTQGTATMAAAVAEATKAGATAERTRIQAITGLEEAKGRETFASHLAMNTAHTVEEAKGLLAAAPKAEAAPAPGPRASDTPVGLVIDKSTREAAASSWDKSLAKAGAKFAN
jgi:signal peptide peptidase SppA